MTRATLFAAITLSATAVACDEAGDTPSSDEATLRASFDALPALGADAVYEGWIIVDGAPVSTGRFSEGDNVFTADAAFIESATNYVLTIEPAVGDVPAPSDVHLLGGDLASGGATLTTTHPAAIGVNVDDAMGTFILATPTTMAMEDFAQGIWYLDPANGPAASLSLPELPSGWVYEGWVVGADGPVSTGRFSAAMGMDSDGAGATAGPDGAPPFPGQDFIDPAVSLIGYTAVISVEPQPDDSPAPFALKPLGGMITDAGEGTLQPLDTLGEVLPTGAVVVE
ncbi:MAG: hypothetical protein ACJA1R_001675 [Flavobacteriales bacterium]|jgi:hypothetical protein